MKSVLYNFLVASLLGLVSVSTAYAVCGVAGNNATPIQVGPPNPNNGFAEYLTDTNGVSLELCLDPGFCFFDPVDPTNAFSTQIGFGFEGFWWLASPDTTNFPATMNAVLTLAAEAAFLGEIVDGGQFPFTRLRFTFDLDETIPGLAGYYRITEPYGVHTYNIQTLVAGREVFDSFDVEFSNGSVDGAGVVTEATDTNNCVAPWLTWDTFATNDPLLDNTGDGIADFIGDGGTPHLITGSPTGNNLFRIEAFADAAMTIPLNTLDPTDADGNGSLNSVETNLFTVDGKVYDGRLATPMVTGRTTYSRDAAGLNGQVDIFISGTETALVSVTGGDNLNGPFSLVGSLGDFFTSELLSPNATVVPPVVAIDATDGGAAIPTDPTHLVRPLVDQVNITRAEYDIGPVTPTLTVKASSSDSLNPPVLTLVELDQSLTAGSVVLTEASPGVQLAPPGLVTVSSSAGGSASHLVEVINSDLDSDGIPNTTDNCPLTANPGQEDVGDSDGIGDACDNCTVVANGTLLPVGLSAISQRDTDGDGYGNMCDADLDGSLLVNLADYGQLSTVWRASAPGVEPFVLADHADFNGDGLVNLGDYAVFSGSLRNAPGPSALAP